MRRMGERGAAAGRVDPGERPISDRTLDLFVAGTPADVAKGVGRLVDAGATMITFSERLGDDPLWTIRVLGGIVSEATHRL